MTTFQLIAIFSVRRGQFSSKIIQDATLQNSYWHFFTQDKYLHTVVDSENQSLQTNFYFSPLEYSKEDTESYMISEPDQFM
jgi:hypothetical protein